MRSGPCFHKAELVKIPSWCEESTLRTLYIGFKERLGSATLRNYVKLSRIQCSCTGMDSSSTGHAILEIGPASELVMMPKEPEHFLPISLKELYSARAEKGHSPYLSLPLLQNVD